MIKIDWNTRIGKYATRLGTATSVLINVILGGASNQTLSARNYQLKRDGKQHFVPFINFLFRDPNHCMESWVYWRMRKDFSYELEKQLSAERKAAIVAADDIKRKYDGQFDSD